ncbi:MAG: aromatic ring-hydroxylating dioxygenase subunit alpha [Gammaproteobacteria bacterium]
MDGVIAARTADLVAQIRAGRDCTLENALTLPPAAYHDAGLFDVERSRVHAREWVCVGRREEFATPGDFLALEIAGEPVLIIADERGEPRVLSNVCRHRGALLAHGRGNAPRLVCPYHAWTYAPDGHLAGAPYMDRSPRFDAAACRLPQYRIECWRGFVFACLDPAAPALAPRLAGLDALVAPYGLETLHAVWNGTEAWSANWKCIAENSVESYHLFRAHRDTIERLRPTALQRFLECGEAWHAHVMPLAEGLPAPADAPASLDAAQRRESLVIMIYPATTLIVTPTDAGWFSLFPQAPRSTRLHYGLAMRQPLPPGEEGARLRAQIEAGAALINGEDRPVVESIDRGTAAAAAARSPLSHLERPVYDFGRYLARML